MGRIALLPKFVVVGLLLAFVASLVIALVSESPADAQGSAVRPVSCSVATTATGAAVAFDAAAGDNAARYLLYRTEDGGGWLWSGSIAADAPPRLTWAETAGVDYAYAVKTRGVGGDFTALTECGDGEPVVEGPGVAPVSCSASVFGGASDIVFTAAADDNAARYLLYRSEDGGGWLWSGSISANAPKMLSWDETAGITYAYAVKTRGTDGGFSGLTECGGEEPPPPAGAPIAPASCSVSRVDNVATITFEAAVGDNAARYLLYRSENEGRSQWTNSIAASADPSFTFAEIDGVSYTYGVKTRGTDGTFTDPTDCTGGDVPPGPVAACSFDQSGSNVTVAWEPNGADNYYIWFYEYDYYTLTATVPGAAAHYTFNSGQVQSSPIVTTEPGADEYSYPPEASTSCDRAAPGGVLPVNPVSCTSTVVGDSVTISFTPDSADAADRYLAYARSAGSVEPTWQGSVASSQVTFTKSGLSAPGDMAWLIKTRTTLADGKRVFSDGTICDGSDVEYVAGDSVAKPFPISGLTSVSGSTLLATREDGEAAIDGNPICIPLDDQNKTALESSVWYAWTPGVTGSVDLGLTTASFGAQVAVYEPTGPVNGYADIAGALQGCGTANVTDPNATLYLQVFGQIQSVYRGNDLIGAGGFTLEFEVRTVAAPPWCAAIIRGDTVELSVFEGAEPSGFITSYEMTELTGADSAVAGSIAANDVQQGFVSVPSSAGRDVAFTATAVGADGSRSAPTACEGPVAPAPDCTYVLDRTNRPVLGWEPNGAQDQNLYLSRTDFPFNSLLSRTALGADAAHYAWGSTLFGSDKVVLTNVDWPTSAVDPDRAYSDLLSPCTVATAGGVLPINPISCSSEVVGNDVTVSWTPVAGDTADRYVLYARSVDEPTETWRGSVAPAETSVTFADLAAPGDDAWLVKARTTMADGTRLFSDGVLCDGSDVDFVPGDSAAEAVAITGAGTTVVSTYYTTTEPGEAEVTFGYNADCDDGPSRLDKTVWYAWTPGEVGLYNLVAYSGVKLVVYAPPAPIDAIGDLAGTQLACGNWRTYDANGPFDIDVTDANATYWIQVAIPVTGQQRLTPVNLTITR